MPALSGELPPVRAGGGRQSDPGGRGAVSSMCRGRSLAVTPIAGRWPAARWAPQDIGPV